MEDELEDVVPIWYVAFENALYVGFDAWGTFGLLAVQRRRHELLEHIRRANVGGDGFLVRRIAEPDGNGQLRRDAAERDVMVLAGSTRLRRHFLAVIELGQRAVPSEVFTTPFMTSVAAWATSAEMTCVPDGWLLSTIRLLFLS